METPAKTRPISVLIPDCETAHAVKVLRCLNRAPAVKTHLLAKTRFPLARFSRYCSSCHHHASRNDYEWLSTIKKLVQKLQIDVVLPVMERGVEFAARNRTAILEFAALPPMPEHEVLMTAQDKWSLYQFATQAGLPAPPSLFVGRAGQANTDSLDLDSIEYPALLKPTLADGGLGIVEVESADDFDRAWKNRNMLEGSRYLLQSYVPGVDLCLNAFCEGGKVVAYALQKSLLSDAGFFGPQRAMDFIENARLLEAGTRLVAALKWEGIVCIDFRLDKRNQTPKLLEMNPRFGQATLGCLAAGVNFPLLACLGALGLEYPEAQRRAVRYAHPIHHGKTLVHRLLGKQTPVPIRWNEGGLKFAATDPLPELVELTRKTIHHFAHKT